MGKIDFCLDNFVEVINQIFYSDHTRDRDSAVTIFDQIINWFIHLQAHISHGCDGYTLTLEP